MVVEVSRLSLRPAVFLDRDGVLNPPIRENGEARAPKDLSEYRLFDGTAAVLGKLAAAGFILVVVTNQPGVARGVERREDVEQIHHYLRRELPIAGVYTCFHDDGDRCLCRKPKPGLFLAAAEVERLDLARSFSVGDHWVDVKAGRNAGCLKNILLVHAESEASKCTPDHQVESLAGAVDWILDGKIVSAVKSGT
jgi:D-glycero-D-manno-heptose 1,7-bisphosphate phosphatase